MVDDHSPGSQPAPAASTAAGAGACDICAAPVRAITWRAAVGDVSQREWSAGRLLYCAGCFALIPGVEAQPTTVRPPR